MTIKKYNKGLLKRKKVLGEQYVNKTIKKTNSFNKDFQKYITEHCWDNFWNSSRLTDKQKSFNTLCILASTNKWPEFKLHLNGAFNNGCTLNELKELFKQISLYAGIPVGVECYKHTEELLLEKNIKIKNSILNKKID